MVLSRHCDVVVACVLTARRGMQLPTVLMVVSQLTRLAQKQANGGSVRPVCWARNKPEGAELGNLVNTRGLFVSPDIRSRLMPIYGRGQLGRQGGTKGR